MSCAVVPIIKISYNDKYNFITHRETKHRHKSTSVAKLQYFTIYHAKPLIPDSSLEL